MEEDWIKCQIAELEKLLEGCKDSEIMRIALQFRIDEFKKELTHFRPKLTELANFILVGKKVAHLRCTFVPEV